MVTQISEFAPGATVRSVIEGALERAKVLHAERASRFAETLGRASFIDLDTPTAALSGGWGKRLAVAAGRASCTTRTFCCATTLPLTWIAGESIGSKRFCRTRPLLAWWSAMTATF